MTDSSTQSIPYVTVSGVSYEISELNENTKLFLSDLVNTVKEYRAVLDSYSQSLTLVNSYSKSLKEEVEKANLPVVYSGTSDESPAIKIDETSYDASDLPNEVKAYINELVKSGNQKIRYEYRLRQLDAARSAYIGAIQSQIQQSGQKPMDPQPLSEGQNAT
jgi:hypothetical protein